MDPLIHLTAEISLTRACLVDSEEEDRLAEDPYVDPLPAFFRAPAAACRAVVAGCHGAGHRWLTAFWAPGPEPAGHFWVPGASLKGATVGGRTVGDPTCPVRFVAAGQRYVGSSFSFHFIFFFFFFFFFFF
jgi:hypothetical protein